VSTATSGLDLEALLTPLPGDNPAGENQQYAGLHDEIREARRSEDDLAQGDWKRDLKAADWEQVERLATEALASKTKDLQVAAWLAEALVNLYGFVGLRDGLKLMCGMHERLWDHVYPEMDEGDLEARANSLAWMDRQLASALKLVEITKGSGPNYSFLKYEESKKFDIPENLESLDSDQVKKLAALKEQAVQEGRVTGEDWRKAKNASRRAFYEEIFIQLNECWDQFQALDRVMDEKFGRQTPGLGELKKTLDDVRTLVEKLVKEKRVLEPDPVAEDAANSGATGEAQSGGAQAGGRAGPIRTRQDAIRRLSEVADFFRATEPHSPVSYLVQRAIHWGQMPLEQWLKDVIKDGGVLENLRETLGIKADSEGSG
jgi:type VI secretion system protein ImpA